MKNLKITKKSIQQDCFKILDLPRKIKYLILHHIEAQNIDDCISTLQNHGVSAHYIIEENGEIFQIVEDQNIAYHAGKSFWNGDEGLNQISIGIEFINNNPFEKKFTPMQILAGAELSKILIDKYAIEPRYVLGHSDIAYNHKSGFLDRKQDPSHLFDWQFLAQNNVGIFPELSNLSDNFFNKEIHPDILFKLGDCNNQIKIIKKKLAFYGYKITNFDENFDEEMLFLVRVFNRHFNPYLTKYQNSNAAKPYLESLEEFYDYWTITSDLMIDELIKTINNE